jgi:pimeloyl-ACP methyl ester carboxylesterase
MAKITVELTDEVWRPPTLLGRAGRAVSRLGFSAGRRGLNVGKKAWSFVRSIDGDTRRHLTQLPLMALTLLAPRPTLIKALKSDGYSRPVLFIYGYGGHPGQFIGMRGLFGARGRTRAYVLDFGQSESLEIQALQLKETVAHILERNGLESSGQVDLVAHSMGGLVCRLALLDDEFARRIGTIITLGTPHSGTALAKFLANGFTMSMRPDSEFIERLKKHVMPAYGPRMLSFWSLADVVVLPPQNARWEGADNREMRGFTHYSYLLNPKCWNAVFESLLFRDAERKKQSLKDHTS